jgi:hypothetical protein
MSARPSPPSGTAAPQIEECLANVREALGGLRFGPVLLTVHEGRVVQIDITERKRLTPR